MMKLKFYSLLILCLLSVSSALHAEIYKWVDDNGKAHFTDRPPVNQQVEEIEVKVNSYEAVEIKPLEKRLGRKNKVVLYTAAWCGYCKKAIRHFKNKRIAYVAYDVEKSRKGRRAYKRLKARSVPIIIVGDKRMNGFNAAAFDKLYAQHMEKFTVSLSKKN